MENLICEEERVNEVLKEYGFGLVREMKKLSGGYANINYKVTTGSGDYLYRWCTQQKPEMIEYEIRLMQKLKEYKFPAAYPYPTLDGHYHVSIEGHYVMLYEFKQGCEPVVNDKTATEMASAIGKLSCIQDLEAFQSKKNVINIEACIQLIKDFPKATYPYPDIFGFFEKKVMDLAPVVNEKLPIGLVHGDAFPNNTIFQNDQLVALIDFEEACVDHSLFDVGMTINGFCFVDNRLDLDLLHGFLQTYQMERTLEDKEIELLPQFIQWCALGMASWHLQFDMLHTYSKDQVDRVRQLLSRVADVDADMENIKRNIQGLIKT